MTISKDLKSVFCFSGERAFTQYDLLTGSELYVYDNSQIGSGTGAGFSRDGELVYSGWTDGFIRIWSMQEKAMLGKIDTANL